MNLLIGAISGNYNPSDIQPWVKSSNEFENTKRVLLLYNPTNNGLKEYLEDNDVECIIPSFDFWGNEKKYFNYDTGKCNPETSYDLIHNIRFLHIYQLLNEQNFDKVFITDVKDLYFNFSPFDHIPENKITATSEIISYNQHNWNMEHAITNIGYPALTFLKPRPVFNVGAWGGGQILVKQLCLDIYLMSVGKYKVADQTSFNYLIQTSYYEHMNFTQDVAIHLHVVSEGYYKFDFNTLKNYSIVHQWDRIEGLGYEA